MRSPIIVFFFYPLVAAATPSLWDFDSDEEENISMFGMMLGGYEVVVGDAQYVEPDRSSYPRCTPDQVGIWKNDADFRDNFVKACNGRSNTAVHVVYIQSIARSLYRTYRNKKGTKICFTCDGEVAACGRHFCKNKCLIDQGSEDCLGCVDDHCTKDFQNCLGVTSEEDMPLRALSTAKSDKKKPVGRPPKKGQKKPAAPVVPKQTLDQVTDTIDGGYLRETAAPAPLPGKHHDQDQLVDEVLVANPESPGTRYKMDNDDVISDTLDTVPGDSLPSYMDDEFDDSLKMDGREKDLLKERPKNIPGKLYYSAPRQPPKRYPGGFSGLMMEGVGVVWNMMSPPSTDDEGGEFDDKIGAKEDDNSEEKEETYVHGRLFMRSGSGNSSPFMVAMDESMHRLNNFLNPLSTPDALARVVGANNGRPHNGASSLLRQMYTGIHSGFSSGFSSAAGSPPSVASKRQFRPPQFPRAKDDQEIPMSSRAKDDHAIPKAPPAAGSPKGQSMKRSDSMSDLSKADNELPK